MEEQLAEWSEATCIGKVLFEQVLVHFLHDVLHWSWYCLDPLQAEGFVRVYPPFINFFDMSKEALQKCDRMYPRFHAFLKVHH